MTSSRKNKTLLIDKEAASALELIKDGLLYPATGLMGEKESQEVLRTGLINGKTFPFPFILAPSGAMNEEVLKSLKKGEEITILCEKIPYASLIVDEVFKINAKDRTKHIYGTHDETHPGVIATTKRIGSYAISGEYTLLNRASNENKKIIDEFKTLINAKHTSSLFMAANPKNRKKKNK